MPEAATIARIRRKYKQLESALDERARRLWAASEALELGWGGVTIVAHATGMSRTTVRAGITEVRSQPKTRKKAALAALMFADRVRAANLSSTMIPI